MEATQSAFAWQREHLLDVFIRKFCQDLRHSLAGGLARAYREKTEEISILRGRLDVMEHIRRPPGNKHRMVCRFDEFDEDTPMNQVLRHCLERLSGLVRSPGLRNTLDELRFQFADVSPLRFHTGLLKNIPIDRTQARFRLVWEQCCWFLRGLYPDAQSGETPYASLLFDMESLFEEAVYRQLRKEWGPRGFDCRFQGPRQALLREGADGPPRRRMKPDITVTTPSGDTVILDCKWKVLDGPGDAMSPVSQISQADLYQLHTYATEYRAKAVGLVFPWIKGLPDNPVQMRFNQVGIPVWLVFVKMDVFDPKNRMMLSEGWDGMLGTVPEGS